MSEPTLNFIADVAQEAGHLIAHLRDKLDISFKDGKELVTQADLAADERIRKRLQEAFPDHALLSEELAPDADKSARHLWVIDPIDGTVNFAHQHSQVAVSIAYYFEGNARLAVVFNPFTHEMFTAEAGKGAWLNGQPLHCSVTVEMKRALIATGFPYHKDNTAELIHRLGIILQNCADIRRLGSAALDICWVACGRLDGYYETVKPWDFAAAQLIAREAGASFGHFSPVPDGENPQLWGEDILISNPLLFAGLKNLLQS